jgi:hypothetical protein
VGWTLLALGLLAAWIVWSSLSVGSVECEVCITYDGRQDCGRAAAPSREEAMRSAATVACALIAPGRASGMDCERRAPDRVSCTP